VILRETYDDSFFTHDKNSAVAVPRSKATSSLPDATSEVPKQKAKVPNRRPAVAQTQDANAIAPFEAFHKYRGVLSYAGM